VYFTIHKIRVFTIVLKCVNWEGDLKGDFGMVAKPDISCQYTNFAKFPDINAYHSFFVVSKIMINR